MGARCRPYAAAGTPPRVETPSGGARTGSKRRPPPTPVSTATRAVGRGRVPRTRRTTTTATPRRNPSSTRGARGPKRPATGAWTPRWRPRPRRRAGTPSTPRANTPTAKATSTTTATTAAPPTRTRTWTRRCSCRPRRCPQPAPATLPSAAANQDTRPRAARRVGAPATARDPRTSRRAKTAPRRPRAERSWPRSRRRRGRSPPRCSTCCPTPSPRSSSSPTSPAPSSTACTSCRKRCSCPSTTRCATTRSSFRHCGTRCARCARPCRWRGRWTDRAGAASCGRTTGSKASTPPPTSAGRACSRRARSSGCASRSRTSRAR
mmetsp:Transcript_3581/g.11199  ORF Transcript_3581/g.11199 Transcript_3581/m.11199 type:complete len:321 (+) Transcript_3581:380-1342(+)